MFDWSSPLDFQLVRTGSFLSSVPTGFFQRGNGWVFVIGFTRLFSHRFSHAEDSITASLMHIFVGINSITQARPKELTYIVLAAMAAGA